MVFGKSASNRASVPSVRPRNSGAADAPASNVMSLELMRPSFKRGMYRVLLAHDLTVQSKSPSCELPGLRSSGAAI
jgi:hypothetical protein